VRHAIDAQIDVVQIREPDLTGMELSTLVSEVVALTRGTSSRVVVNDRLDVALACGADGVHLRGDSAPAAAVRANVPKGFLIGQSIHTVAEAAAVAPHVDYLIAGTVWPSASKNDGSLVPATLLGTAGLSDIVRAVSRPVLAIGGVDLDRMAAVAASGAAGAAAIGLFLGQSAGPDAKPCNAIPLDQIVQLARARFDGSGYH
jgi:thiamine-phosphate diphosphorylase